MVASRAVGARAGGAGGVSIPFIAGQWSLRGPRRGRGVTPRVSIPFIAGQWSLPDPDLHGVRLALGFNPLHCGAVVASSGGTRRGGSARVSIPFIAGQWSLRPLGGPAPGDGVGFQSPSLRGSGRFGDPALHGVKLALACFNPLHCGAVVASPSAGWGRGDRHPVFQSPSLRGSGRFKRLQNQLETLARLFQSPSLRGSGRFARVGG